MKTNKCSLLAIKNGINITRIKQEPCFLQPLLDVYYSCVFPRSLLQATASAHLPVWFLLPVQHSEASVLLLTRQKWVNVIMWPQRWGNPSPTQQQGNVLLTNPWAMPPFHSSNSSIFSSPLLSLIFLFSQLKSELGRFLWQLAAHHCPSMHVGKHALIQVYAYRIILKVHLHMISSSSFVILTQTESLIFV